MSMGIRSCPQEHLQLCCRVQLGRQAEITCNSQAMRKEHNRNVVGKSSLSVL